MSILRGRCGTVKLSPGFRIKTKKVFSGGGKSDQNHVDKRILEGKGSQYEDSTSIRNFCPASALRPRCCIDTKRCSCGSTQPEDSTKAQQA